MGFWSEEVLNAAEKQKSEGFDLLPHGDYTIVLINVDVQETKKGNGHYIDLSFEISEGKCKGRKLFHKVNVNNPNPQAVSIGLGELKQLCSILGTLAWYEKLKMAPTWEEAEAYLYTFYSVAGNKPLVGNVVIDGQYNRIKRFSKIELNATPNKSPFG